MGVPLKGLLGKTKRAIIVNGSLLRVGRQQVVANLMNYHTAYYLAGSNQMMSEEEGDKLILSRIKRFNEKFSDIPLDVKSEEGAEGQVEVGEVFADSYTGAVEIESPLYRALYAPHMHEIGVQHTPQVAQAVLEFVKQYTADYMDSYVYLYNKRITSPHSSIATRCHFVAGFYQPLIVESAGLRSPFNFGQNKWFSDLFADEEEYMERSYDSPRKLNLSCVAMCDIAKKFNTPVVTQLDRNMWMFMCIMVVLNQIDPEKALEFTKNYGHLFKKIREDQGAIELLSSMMLYADKARKAVRTV